MAGKNGNNGNNGQTEGFEFDLTGLKVGEFRKLMAISLLDDETCEEGFPMLAKRVKAWPFEGDPANPASYNDLDWIGEWKPLIKAFQEAISGRSKALGK